MAKSIRLLLPLLGFVLLPAQASDFFSKTAGGDHLAYCAYGPRVRVLSPVVKSSNRCEGTAKVQAMRWECQAQGKVAETLESFRRSVIDEAREACRKHCADRGRGCVGRFQAPSRCGLETDSEEAHAAGKRLGCRSDCGGQELVFCSIYDAGYRLDDPDRIARQAPNCDCVLTRR